jgi:uroporphyrinogen-III synthase
MRTPPISKINVEKRGHVMNLPIKSNLFAVAHDDGKEASLQQSLRRTLVASIGPACSGALRKLAVRVDIEPKPPKLGAFIDAINAALSDRSRLDNS